MMSFSIDPPIPQRHAHLPPAFEIFGAAAALAALKASFPAKQKESRAWRFSMQSISIGL
jgi:hypothetical protein